MAIPASAPTGARSRQTGRNPARDEAVPARPPRADAAGCERSVVEPMALPTGIASSLPTRLSESSHPLPSDGKAPHVRDGRPVRPRAYHRAGSSEMGNLSGLRGCWELAPVTTLRDL